MKLEKSPHDENLLRKQQELFTKMEDERQKYFEAQKKVNKKGTNN